MGALVLAGLVTVLEILEAIAAWVAAPTYAEAARSGVSLWDVVTVYDLVAIPLLLALVAAYVVTCLWLWSARRFAEAASPALPHARKAGWIWAGWLVPVVSLWFPFQIVRDIRRATVPAARSSSQVVGFWWVAFLTYNILTYAISRLTLSQSLQDSLGDILGPLEYLNALAAVAACSLWVLVVREIVRDQQTAATKWASSDSVWPRQ